MSQAAVRGASEGRGHPERPPRDGLDLGLSKKAVYHLVPYWRVHSYKAWMNESPPSCQVLACVSFCSVLAACGHWEFRNQFPVFWCYGQILTCYVPCSLSRSTSGVLLHHDGHAARRGFADLQRADQTCGGGGGSGAGSRVRPHRHTLTHEHQWFRSKWIIDSMFNPAPKWWSSNRSLAAVPLAQQACQEDFLHMMKQRAWNFNKSNTLYFNSRDGGVTPTTTREQRCTVWIKLSGFLTHLCRSRTSTVGATVSVYLEFSETIAALSRSLCSLEKLQKLQSNRFEIVKLLANALLCLIFLYVC